MDVYELLIYHFELVKIVFLDKSMMDMWVKLNGISEYKTEKFVNYLLHIKDDFFNNHRLLNKHKNEKNCFSKIIKISYKLSELLEEYECHYYGHLLTDQFYKLQNILSNFQQASGKQLKDFTEETKNIDYLKSYDNPINRELKNNKALELFFVRKIFLYFKHNFQKPFHKLNSNIVNLIFNSNYIDNDIIKLTQKLSKQYDDSSVQII